MRGLVRRDNPILWYFTGGEAGKGRLGDLDGLAGLRVATGAGRTLAGVEGSKSHQYHPAALLGQGRGDGFHQCVQRGGDFGLGLSGLFGKACNQFGFVHGDYSQ